MPAIAAKFKCEPQSVISKMSKVQGICCLHVIYCFNSLILEIIDIYKYIYIYNVYNTIQYNTIGPKYMSDVSNQRLDSYDYADNNTGEVASRY